MKNIILINDTSYNPHHGCELIGEVLKLKLKKHKLKLVRSFYNEENYNDITKSLSQVLYDGVIINGEGTIHDKKNYSETIFKLINFFNKKKIKTYIINSVIQNLPSKNLLILKKVNQVYVRESNSFNYLKSKKIKSYIVPDLLFNLNYKLKNIKCNNKILVTDSTVKKKSLALFEFAKKNNFKYLPLIKRPKLKINKNLYYIIYLYLAYFKNKILMILYKRRTNFTDLYVNQNEFFLRKIYESRFIITGRFHALVIALAIKKPFCALTSNTYKMEGLLKDIGLKSKKRLIKSNNLKKIKNLDKDFSKNEIKKIKNYIKKSKIKTEGMFKSIYESI